MQRHMYHWNVETIKANFLGNLDIDIPMLNNFTIVLPSLFDNNEVIMKLKLKYFGPIMKGQKSLESAMMLGKIKVRREKKLAEDKRLSLIPRETTVDRQPW